MNLGLFAFIVILAIATGAAWLRLVGIILRGHWPPMNRPVRPPQPALRPPDHHR